MAIPDKAITRNEQYLSAMAGQSGRLPDAPITRKERYLAKAAGQDVETPEPITREEMYLDVIAGGGGGGGEAVLINKTVTANGTYTATDDEADGYSSVTVDVAGGEPVEVPDGYTQLKYVESTGTQIVNTGVTPTLDTKIEIQFYMMPGSGNFPFSTGCTNPIICVAVNGGTAGGGYSSFGNVVDKTLDHPHAGGDAPIYTVSKDEATGRTSPGLPVQSVAINATALGNVNPATRIGIFGRYNGDTPERFALMRFFREKIWDGDTLLREFVPAMENATEEVGLYDIVNGVFYRNAGTGVLVGGAR